MKYTVFAGGEATELTRSNKQAAIDLATTHRDENKVAVEVRTESGTVVHSQAAPKKINMSPQFSRDVSDKLPEGVTVPEGVRVAYFRPRIGLAVLHNSDPELEKAYSVLDTKKNKVLRQHFATSREVGRFMTDKQAEAKAAKAAEAETPAEPANA